MKTKLITIEQLKPHEQTSQKHILELVKLIKQDGILKEPILVEKNTFVILDGHHRVQAMKILGYKKIPAKLVDYDEVEVSLRRKNLPSNLIKEIVLYLAKRKIVLPRKSTRHVMIS